MLGARERRASVGDACGRMAGHVFISHGSENREARARASSRRGVRPGSRRATCAPAGLFGAAAGRSRVPRLRRAGHRNGQQSPYVRAETEMAFEHKPIFPVRSDIKPAAGLAFFLKIRHWTDAYGEARASWSGSRRAQALSGGLGAGAAAGAANAPPPLPPPAPATPHRRHLSACPRRGGCRDRLVRMAIGRTSMASSAIGWRPLPRQSLWFAYRKLWLVAVMPRHRRWPYRLRPAARRQLCIVGPSSPADSATRRSRETPGARPSMERSRRGAGGTAARRSALGVSVRPDSWPRRRWSSSRRYSRSRRSAQPACAPPTGIPIDARPRRPRSSFFWAARIGRGVAQPGRALSSGGRGRRFESSLPDHHPIPPMRGMVGIG